jgi:hypothetical protein
LRLLGAFPFIISISSDFDKPCTDAGGVFPGEHATGTQRLAELERLFDAIRSAPIDVVDGLVGKIRADKCSRALHHSGLADEDEGKHF